MDKDIKYAYTELKNRFGEKKDVIFNNVVGSKEVANKTIVKTNEQCEVTPVSTTKTRTNVPTTESLLELQKYFNFK